MAELDSNYITISEIFFAPKFDRYDRHAILDALLDEMIKVDEVDHEEGKAIKYVLNRAMGFSLPNSNT